MYSSFLQNEYSNFHSICHMFIGMLSLQFPSLWYILILPYQFLQYFLNCRFFINELRIKKYNSISHTLYKLTEYVFGLVTTFWITLIKTLISI